MKRLIIVLLPLLFNITCTNKRASLTWWFEAANPNQRQWLNELMEVPFETMYPEYDLSIDYRGNTLDQQLRVALLSGTGPDIIQTPGPGYLATMVKAGQLMPLDKYADEFGWRDRILDVFLNMGSYDGKLYFLPKTYETIGLFYNSKMFEDNDWNIPKTIPEMEAIADEMITMNIVPFAAGSADWRQASEWFVSIVFNSVAGPNNFYKAMNGEIPWTSQPFIDAVDKLKEWWDKGYFGENYHSLTIEQAFATLSDGTAAMAPTGTWSFQYIPTYFKGREDEVGFVGFPSAEGLPTPIYMLGIGSTFSISNNSSNPYGAAKAINFMFSDKFYGDINTVWQGEWNMPLRDLSKVTIAESVIPQYRSSMVELANAVAKNQYGYTTWTFMPPATSNYLHSGIEEVWFDAIDSGEFLGKIDKLFQEEKAEGKVPAIPAR